MRGRHRTVRSATSSGPRSGTALAIGIWALVAGYAGTGKSTILSAAREAWEAPATRCGARPCRASRPRREGGSGIKSRTIASLEHAWGHGRDPLTKRDVLVIDEAGMVGSRQMERVLSNAAEAGGKVGASAGDRTPGL